MGAYTPVGDLVTISVCYVMLVLMFFSYNKDNRSFRIFLSIVVMLLAAAHTNIVVHILAGKPETVETGFGMRCVFHALLYWVFALFSVYIGEVTRLERSVWRRFLIGSTILFLGLTILDIVFTVRGSMIFEAQTDTIRTTGYVNTFPAGYVAYVAFLLVMLYYVRNILYRKVMLGFYGTMAVSFIVNLIQGLLGETSFTVATFLFPVLGMFYIMHSNPYDAHLGAMDVRAFEDAIRRYYERKREFLFVSLYMRQFDEEGMVLPEGASAVIREFAGSFFKGAVLFQVAKGHEVLLIRKKQNPDYEDRYWEMLRFFDETGGHSKYDYKIVLGSNIDEISRKNEYVGFIRSIHRTMAEREIHRVVPEDVSRFSRGEVIQKALEDIYRKCDLDDPRVLAYCQPVLNTKTKKYDTAEALMRLKLDDLGLVFPDEFIPMAEECGYIHVLTEIILNKTCKEIRRLSDEGYAVNRISVNVSVLEMKDDDFCEDIDNVINVNGVSGDKVAIELTESRNDDDFLLMKDKIYELRKQGIKFYLDDFGTGYSNMERIMELPFDIIKFDRSMVLASDSSERSRQMVVGLANIFANMNYSVLYEGVEDDTDESMCLNMYASYLQGYKYSRPVPITELKEFLDMTG